MYDSPSTPRFESEEEFYNQKQKNSNFEIENNSPIKHDSVLTLSKYVFDKEPFTPQIFEPKLCESTITKPKIKNTSSKRRIPKIENFNKHKNERNVFSDTNLINKFNKKIVVGIY